MEDEKIIALYFERSEEAISETKRKYDGFCTTIAYNILSSFEDSQECVSDAYFKTWNTIPPTRPLNFKGFLGRITRNLALDRYRHNTARKYSGLGEILHEFQIVSLEEPGDAVERKELAASISGFLRTLPPFKQKIFLRRYWYCESVASISRETGMKEEQISTELYRMRKKLKMHLEREGYEV